MNTRVAAGGVSRRPNRALRALAIVSIVLGALALIDAGITLVWQEPITALIALVRQNHLSGELRKVERASPTTAEQRALSSLRDERLPDRVPRLGDAAPHSRRQPGRADRRSRAWTRAT